MFNTHFLRHTPLVKPSISPIKALTIFCMIFLFSTSMAEAQSNMSVYPTAGLKAYWPFDGDLKDKSGNGNDLIKDGGRLWPNRFNQQEKAYEINSKEYYLTFTNPIGPDSTWTISLWAYPTSGSGTPGMIFSPQGWGGYIPQISIPKSGNIQFKDKNNNRHRWNGGGNTQNVNMVDYADEWHHYIFYADGINLYLLIDGRDMGYITPASTLTTFNKIGIDQNTQDNFWYNYRGYYDEIRIYDRTLTSHELEAVKGASYETSVAGIFSKNDSIGIGLSTPAYPLDIKGTARAEELIVEVTPGSGPDYVFDDNYPLRSLQEIERYIDQFHHLPDMPPASELEDTGMSVGEMNLLLLRKIEELTLHLIQQEKEIQRLKLK